MKRRFFILITFSILILILWIFRIFILQSIGNFLIVEDEIRKAGVIFVLGGDAFDRGKKAAALYKAGFGKKVVCTSNYIPPDLAAMNIHLTEAEITRACLMKNGVDSNSIDMFRECMSTMDESNFFLGYCKKRQIKTVLIITGKFHTRRVNNVFRKKFDKEGITICLTGVGNREFKEEEWWRNEYGLIALNNEYVKLFYYWVKY